MFVSGMNFTAVIKPLHCHTSSKYEWCKRAAARYWYHLYQSMYICFY